MINVVLADDHALVRQGLKQILLAQSDFAVGGEAANHGEVMQLLRRSLPDVLVLDINMPGKNGIDTLKQAKQEFPRLPVLMLSMYPEDQYAVRALKAGAAGYMNKEHAAESLAPALRKIASGGRYVSDTLAEMLAFNLTSDDAQSPHETLSNREFQVLVLLAQGKTANAIAADLMISVKTVSTYRARILEKLGLTSNAEMVRYALEKSLI